MCMLMQKDIAALEYANVCVCRGPEPELLPVE